MYASLLNFPSGLFSDFDRVRREFDDLFGMSAVPSSIRSVAPGTFPPINVGTTPTSVEVYAFAPGLNVERIDVTLDRGVLTLSGERADPSSDSTDAKVQVHTRERSRGAFKRAVSLPDDVDVTRVKATYRDGILQVSIARREAPQPQRIAVQ